MKEKDITLIAVMVFVGAIVGLVASRFLLVSPTDRQQTAEVVDVITSDFPEPSAKYFNEMSVNPTQQIEIGSSNNPNPFNVPSQ